MLTPDTAISMKCEGVMSNETADTKELLLLSEATGAFTREALNKVFNSCSRLLDDDLPQYVKESIAGIDADCCKLLRNRMLLGKLIRNRLEEPRNAVCSFTDVYANCCEAVNAICLQEKVGFSFSAYYPESKIPLSADECCTLLTLPVALSCMAKNRKDMGVRLIASKSGKRIKLEYTFNGEVPDVYALAEECKKTDRSSGVFFPEPLIAFSLVEAVRRSGSIMTVKGKNIVILLDVCDDKKEITSRAFPYIDNRFSIPYLMLADIVKLEI